MENNMTNLKEFVNAAEIIYKKEIDSLMSIIEKSEDKHTIFMKLSQEYKNTEAEKIVFVCSCWRFFSKMSKENVIYWWKNHIRQILEKHQNKEVQRQAAKSILPLLQFIVSIGLISLEELKEDLENELVLFPDDKFPKLVKNYYPKIITNDVEKPSTSYEEELELFEKDFIDKIDSMCRGKQYRNINGNCVESYHIFNYPEKYGNSLSILPRECKRTYYLFKKMFKLLKKTHDEETAVCWKIQLENALNISSDSIEKVSFTKGTNKEFINLVDPFFQQYGIK